MPHTRIRLLAKEKKARLLIYRGVCLYMVWEHIYDTGQHAGISSALPSFQRSNSGRQTCRQAPLPTGLFHCPLVILSVDAFAVSLQMIFVAGIC